MLYTILLLLTTFSAYFSSLSFFFVSDDWYNLSIRNWSQVLLLTPSENHFFPASWVVLLFLKSLFLSNPFFYHLFLVSLFSIIVLLVQRAAQYIFFQKRLSFLTALLFIFFFANYEVVFWISGTFIELSLFWYLLGFIFFARLLQHKNISNYVFFCCCSVLAFLSHEFGISLLFLCSSYALTQLGVQKSIRKLYLFVIPLVLWGLIIIGKLLIVTVPLTPSHISLSRAILSFHILTAYSVYPNPYFWEIGHLLRGNMFGLILFGTICITLILYISFHIKRTPQIVTALLTLIITSLLIACTTVPQSRYYFFLAFPATVLLVSLLQQIRSRALQYLLVIALIVPQGFFLYQRTEEWARASAITIKAINEIPTNQQCAPQLAQYGTYIGDDRWKAYTISHPEKIAEFFFSKNCPLENEKKN